MQILSTLRANLSWRALRERSRELVRRLLNERATPKEVGQAVAIGVFMGTSPALGLHGWLAIGMATLLRRNRLFAFVGSRVSFFLIMPWIVLAEIETAHWLRFRSFAPIEHEHILAEASTYVLDWCLGWLVVGPVSSVVLGLATVPLWAWWSARSGTRQAKELTPDTPLPLPPPSSGSPR